MSRSACGRLCLRQHFQGTGGVWTRQEEGDSLTSLRPHKMSYWTVSEQSEKVTVKFPFSLAHVTSQS